jgi:hypothetical protein
VEPLGHLVMMLLCDRAVLAKWLQLVEKVQYS